MKKPADETVAEFVELLIDFALYFASKTRVEMNAGVPSLEDLCLGISSEIPCIVKHDLEAKHYPDLVDCVMVVSVKSENALSQVLDTSESLDSVRSSTQKGQSMFSHSRPLTSSVISPKSTPGRFKIFSDEPAMVHAPVKLNKGIELPKPSRQSLPAAPAVLIHITDQKAAVSFMNEYLHDILTHPQELLSKKIVNYSAFLKLSLKSFDVLLAHQHLLATNPEQTNIFLNTYMIPLLDDFSSRLSSSDNSTEKSSLQAIIQHLVKEYFALSRKFSQTKAVSTLIQWLSANMLGKLNKLEILGKAAHLFVFEVLAEEYRSISLLLGYKERDLLVQTTTTALASVSDRLTRLITSGFNGILPNQSQNSFEMFQHLPKVLHLLKNILEVSHKLLTAEVED